MNAGGVWSAGGAGSGGPAGGGRLRRMFRRRLGGGRRPPALVRPRQASQRRRAGRSHRPALSARRSPKRLALAADGLGRRRASAGRRRRARCGTPRPSVVRPARRWLACRLRQAAASGVGWRGRLLVVSHLVSRPSGSWRESRSAATGRPPPATRLALERDTRRTGCPARESSRATGTGHYAHSRAPFCQA